MQIKNIQPLVAPIEVMKTVQLYSYIFENFDQKPAVIKFMCMCGNLNHIHLHYMERAFLFSDLYEKGILDKQTILEYKMGKEMPNGEVVVDKKLQTSLYNTFECPFCKEQFLMVYGVGELNPNRFICCLSGVFNYKFKKEKL